MSQHHVLYPDSTIAMYSKTSISQPMCVCDRYKMTLELVSLPLRNTPTRFVNYVAISLSIRSVIYCVVTVFDIYEAMLYIKPMICF